MLAFRCRWMVADGRTINVVKDPWISTVLLACYPYTIDYEALDNKMVCDSMATGTRTWGRGLTEQCFGGELSS